MNNHYLIDANARKSMKNARDWIDKVKNDSSVNNKSWAIHYMGKRAESEGKKKIASLFKKAMQELRQEALERFQKNDS